MTDRSRSNVAALRASDRAEPCDDAPPSRGERELRDWTLQVLGELGDA